LDALKDELNFKKQIIMVNDEFKIYNFANRDGKILPIIYRKNEIDEIVEKIITKRNSSGE
jgi:hypothetical protein